MNIHGLSHRVREVAARLMRNLYPLNIFINHMKIFFNFYIDTKLDALCTTLTAVLPVCRHSETPEKNSFFSP